MHGTTRTLLGWIFLLFGLVLVPIAGVADPAPATDLAGDPLPAGARARFGSLRLRHGPEIGSLALSPNGKLVASVNNDPEGKEQEDGAGVSVRVWETASGKRIAEQRAPKKGTIHTVVFGKEGRLFLLGLGPVCTAWDFRKGETKVLFKGKQDPAVVGAFAPDGKALAVGLESGLVLVFDPVSGQEQAVLRPWKHKQPVTALAFSASSGRLAVGHADGHVRLWNLAQKKLVRAYAPVGPDAGDTQVLCFAPQDQSLAILTAGTLRLMQTEANGPVKGFTPPQLEEMAGVSFTPDGKQLIGFDLEGRMFRWDARTGKQISVTDKKLFEEGAFDGVVVLNPAAGLAAAGSGNTIVLIDLKTGQALHENLRFPALLQVRWLGRQLVACSGMDRGVRTWDPATGKLVRSQPTSEGVDLEPADLSPDGKRLALLGEEGLRVFEGKKELWKGDEGTAEATCVRFSPDGRSLAVAYALSVEVRDSATGKIRRTLALNTNPVAGHQMSWSRDGRLLAVAGGEHNEVPVWELATGRIRHRIFVDNPHQLAFSGDGRHLVVVAVPGQVRVLELGVEKPCLDRKATEAGVNALAVSPDSTRLALSDGQVIRVWDMAGKELAVLRGHDGQVLDLAFSPDGRALVSSSEDGTAVVWDVPASTVRARTTPLQWKGDSWKQLADADPELAFPAMRALQQQPAEALELFSARLVPAGRVDNRRVERLLADLDSDEFQTREKAEAELRSLDAAIEGTLRAVLANPPSAEVKRAVERLLEGIEDGAGRPERIREMRAVEVLESLGTPEARLLLEKLARGGTSRLTALAREVLERLGK